ncbi:hypothetical protein NPIL_144421 [Nephila pilipes]|uniref:Uncharacterized protein n=1 Tax=Nephila pilipes TaxID=299642 RepID=A0A8X6P8Y6_NEPPI|nr:hypothetical protein NPIL_144401 [Nephila pilipes]GFT52493.1 hypothetical protein NPIL_144421 [Nephila pilipes]
MHGIDSDGLPIPEICNDIGSGKFLSEDQVWILSLWNESRSLVVPDKTLKTQSDPNIITRRNFSFAHNFIHFGRNWARSCRIYFIKWYDKKMVHKIILSFIRGLDSPS